MFSFLKLGGIRLLGENLGREGEGKELSISFKRGSKGRGLGFPFFPFHPRNWSLVGKRRGGVGFFPFFSPFPHLNTLGC